MPEPGPADEKIDSPARAGDEPVLFVTPLAGWRFAANIAAGVVVCAAVGSCLGLAINRIWIGAVFGALVAVSGVFFARRRDELPVLQIERGPEARTLFVELRRGASQTWRAGDVTWFETLSEGDEDAAKTWWVVVRRPGVVDARFRTRDGDQAAELVLAMRDALGLTGPDAGASAQSKGDTKVADAAAIDGAEPASDVAVAQDSTAVKPADGG
ncbi:MAG: hypothetical protein WCJ30_26680 [Deltaproteobacteria bacterium]